MKSLKFILIIIFIGMLFFSGCQGKKSEVQLPPLESVKMVPTNDGVVFETKINGSDIESSNDIIVTSDGGYMIAGYTYSKGAGKGDAYLAKCSAAGNIEWDRTYGGTENDQVFTVVQTIDGGYAAAGRTDPAEGEKRDLYFIKVDGKGNPEWEKSFGGDKEDEAMCIIQTKDRGYFIAGMTYSKGAGNGDYYLLKLNENGGLEWEKTYGGNKKDFAAHAEQTADGGYIICGSGGDKTDIYILKLDQKGNMQWEKFLGGENFELANCIIPTSRGGYVVAGLTQTEANAKVDVYVAKLTDNGDMEWEKQIGGKDHSGAQNVKETSDHGFIVSGSTKNTESGFDNAFLMKFNSRGDVEWQEVFGGSDIAYGNCVVEKSPGLYTVAGYILATSGPAKGDYSIYFFSYQRHE